MKSSIKYLALAAAVAGLSEPVKALPTLYLSTNGVAWTQVAVDNGAGDTLPGIAGKVSWGGNFGGFAITVDTGTTLPLLGSPAFPILDLSYDATSSGAGSLFVAFSVDNLGPTSGGTFASVSVTSNGPAVSYKTYGGNSNVLNDQTNLLTSQGPFGAPGAFSSVSGPLINAASYSLTQVVRMDFTASGQHASGDAFLQVPESGTSILLLGAGLTGIGLMARARRRIV